MICIHCQTELPDDSKFCTQCGADPSDPGSGPRTGRAGQTVADLGMQLEDALGERYELKTLLGRGGMGAVFLAEDRTLERPVAIKVLPPELAHDGNFVGRFEREARTAAKLDHPGIIPIYAVEHKDDLYYFVMKYVTGRSLDDVIRSGPVPIDAVQRIMWESAVALGHAHSRGVVHRDIKPGNIMVDDAGRAMLTDFGISKASQAATQFTATGQVIGTPHYMSPEQAKGLPVDGRSDQYSLAVVAYRMLTGRLPFADESVHTVIYKHIFEDPEPVEQFRPETPPFLATALKRAMAKDPNDRYPTMEDFASAVWPENRVTSASGLSPAGVTGPAMVDAATQLTPQTPKPAATGAAPAKKKSFPVVAVVAAVVVLGGGGAGAFLMFGKGGGEQSPSAEPPPQTTVTQPAAAAQTEPAPQAPAQETPAPVQQQPVQPPPQVPVQQQPAQPQPQPARPRTGSVTIDAQPFGTVFVDGALVGDTPIFDHELTAGAHVIEVRKEGYVTQVDSVTIVVGQTLRRRYRLEREGGL